MLPQAGLGDFRAGRTAGRLSARGKLPSTRRLPGSPLRPLQRVKMGVLALLVLILGGSLGYYLIGWYYGNEEWSFLRCLYMMVITVTTIGYGDILGTEQQTLSMLYTVFAALVGMGVSLYVISMTTAFIVEGDLKNILWSRRMSKTIQKMSDHYIVCGMGETAIHIVSELVATRRSFIAVDSDEQLLRKLQDRLGVTFPVVPGDALEDETLIAAGVHRAAGLVAALADDRDNIYLSLTARQLNPALRIVAKGVEKRAADKLRQAGADAVVSPSNIGGLRMVSELVRPETVTFLDTMLRDREHCVRFEDLRIAADCPAAGKNLADLGLGSRLRLLAVAVCSAEASGGFDYCPDPGQPLTPGMTLVVLGEAANVQQARAELFTVPTT